MTFRELFKKQNGYDVIMANRDKNVYPCPSKYGYEAKNPTICRRMLDCKSCWEREVPQKEPTKWKIERVQKAADAANSVREEVNHPAHYAGKFECIDVMEDIYGKQAVIDFCLCNAFKYLWRSKHKHETPLTDLKKAKFYIDWVIDKLGEQK